jgi:hypothetical protein
MSSSHTPNSKSKGFFIKPAAPYSLENVGTYTPENVRKADRLLASRNRSGSHWKAFGFIVVIVLTVALVTAFALTRG